jgi:hypothetical protein
MFLVSEGVAQETNVIVNGIGNTSVITNFEVVFSSAKMVFTNGEPIVCSTGLTNTSDMSITIIPSVVQANLNVLVTNANGIQVPYAKRIMNYGFLPGTEVVLPHHAERRVSPLVISDLFDLPAGTYRLCAVREWGPTYNGVVNTSKVVTINIVESLVPTTTNTPGVRTK